MGSKRVIYYIEGMAGAVGVKLDTSPPEMFSYPLSARQNIRNNSTETLLMEGDEVGELLQVFFSTIKEKVNGEH